MAAHFQAKLNQDLNVNHTLTYDIIDKQSVNSTEILLPLKIAADNRDQLFIMYLCRPKSINAYETWNSIFKNGTWEIKKDILL